MARETPRPGFHENGRGRYNSGKSYIYALFLRRTAGNEVELPAAICEVARCMGESIGNARNLDKGNTLKRSLTEAVNSSRASAAIESSGKPNGGGVEGGAAATAKHFRRCSRVPEPRCDGAGSTMPAEALTPIRSDEKRLMKLVNGTSRRALSADRHGPRTAGPLCSAIGRRTVIINPGLRRKIMAMILFMENPEVTGKRILTVSYYCRRLCSYTANELQDEFTHGVRNDTFMNPQRFIRA